MTGCIIPATPYSSHAGCNTLFGDVEMHSEHAVHSLLKSEIDPAPGGQTGDVLFSLTVDSFLGLGASLFWPRNSCGKPKRSNNVPAINFLLSGSAGGFGTSLFLLIFTKPYERAFSGQAFIQLKQSTHLLTSILGCRKSMQDDLQPREHLPHLVHLLSSNLILRTEIFEISPSRVPTGQIILQ